MTNINETKMIIITSAAIALFLGVMLWAESQLLVLALVLLGGVGAYGAAKSGYFQKFEAACKKNTKSSSACVLLGLLALAVFFHQDHFILLMITTVLIYAIACMGLNIQFGYSGLVNFAGAAFFGAGGYTAAVLTQMTDLSHLVVIGFGGLVSVVIGLFLILPVLRTKGHYAAVVTIAFSLLFRTLVEVNPTLGGAQGSAVQGVNLFGWDFNRGLNFGGLELSFYMNYLMLAVVLAVAVYVLVKRIENSWIGLSMDSIRLDETASACFGLNVARWKVTAFVLGNFIMGIAGAFYAMMLGFIAPNNFTFGDSLIMVSIILLGGLGSMRGILLASALVIILPEKLQAVQEYRFLLFAIGVMLVLLFLPNGLLKRGVRTYFNSKKTEVKS